MRIGIDLDNTIVCYDELFHRFASENGVVPRSLEASKTAVRDHLRATDREQDWIELQGYIYGKQIFQAPSFEGVNQFVSVAEQFGHSICIISHKTNYSNCNDKYDLHQAARAWLSDNGFKAFLERGDAYFETTKGAKLKRIINCKCNVFIDDLPEFLMQPEFPKVVKRILFDPFDKFKDEHCYSRFNTWLAIADRIAGVLV